jgi:hypothetical protein
MGFSLHQLYEEMGLLLWGFWLVWLVLGVLVGLGGFGFDWSILE